MRFPRACSAILLGLIAVHLHSEEQQAEPAKRVTIVSLNSPVKFGDPIELSVNAKGFSHALTYRWFCLFPNESAMQPIKAQTTAIACKFVFSPNAPGTYKFVVFASDLTSVEMAETEVLVIAPHATEKLTEDNPPSDRLKAVATVTPQVANVARRGPNPGNNIIVLDGTRSKPTDASFTYQWKQIGGDELKLNPNALAKVRVGLRIYKPGKYKFQLIVSDAAESSAPAEVEVEVVDPDDK